MILWENPGCREGRIMRPFARRRTHAYKRSFSTVLKDEYSNAVTLAFAIEVARLNAGAASLLKGLLWQPEKNLVLLVPPQTVRKNGRARMRLRAAKKTARTMLRTLRVSKSSSRSTVSGPTHRGRVF